MVYFQWLSNIATTIGDNSVGAVLQSFCFANCLCIALLKRKLLLLFSKLAWCNWGTLMCFCSACYLFHEGDGGKLFEQRLLSPENKPCPFGQCASNRPRLLLLLLPQLLATVAERHEKDIVVPAAEEEK